MPIDFHKSEWKGDRDPEDPLNLMTERRTSVCHPRCLLVITNMQSSGSAGNAKEAKGNPHIQGKAEQHV